MVEDQVHQTVVQHCHRGEVYACTTKPSIHHADKHTVLVGDLYFLTVSCLQDHGLVLAFTLQEISHGCSLVACIANILLVLDGEVYTLCYEATGSIDYTVAETPVFL